MGTSGNDQTHVVLRGGATGPNFAAEPVAAAVALLRKFGLPPHVMVDCSHANSSKDPERQPEVAADVAARVAGGDRSVCAVMIESNLLGGSQDFRARPLVRGRSITDACLPWEKTLPVLARLAEAARARRGAGSAQNSQAAHSLPPPAS
jgi:3-deoxy-7-phosphoheptulonate synthase